MSDTSQYPSHPRREAAIADCGLQIADWKPKSTSRNPQSAIVFCLVLALMLAVSARPAHASTPARPAQAAPVVTSTPIAQTPVFAFLGLGKYLENLAGSRTTVVRFCVVVMALALFILLKK
jgi:hypothetical protein